MRKSLEILKPSRDSAHISEFQIQEKIPPPVPSLTVPTWALETADIIFTPSQYAKPAETDTEKKNQLSRNGWAASVYLVYVRDEFALPWHVDFLIVGSHFALDGKKQHFQISFFCKPEQNFPKE